MPDKTIAEIGLSSNSDITETYQVKADFSMISKNKDIPS